MIRVMYLAIHKITMKFTFFHTRENTNNKEKFEFEMGVDSGPSNNAQYALYAQYMPSCYISQDISGHI